MQASWKRLKASMYAATSPVRVPAGPVSPPRRTTSQRRTPQASSVPVATKPVERPVDKPAAKPVAKPAITPAAKAQAAPAPDSRLVRIQTKENALRTRKPSNQPDLGVKVRPSPPVRSSPPPVATGSVSDVIKRLSGRGYDVYRDIFLAKARPAIREVLLRQPNRPASLFGEELNEAENLVHEFLERNYANPYMDWKTSGQYARLEATGYQLGNIEEVIEACYKRLN